jgi:hypothetical protein
MSTQAGDGDHFRDPVGFDGLSPVIHPAVEVIRAVLVRDDRVEPISSFSDMHADHMSFRLPVGPTLKFQRQ